MQRPLTLERAGWIFWRCFASTWTQRKDEVLNELIERMQRMGIESLGAMEQTPSLVEYREWPQASPTHEAEVTAQLEPDTGVLR